MLSFVVVAMQINGAQAQVADSGLVDEVMLHPLDAFTAFTLHQGEWKYNQALDPFPSWVEYGLTDRLTLQMDFNAWVGGVPGLFMRYRLNQNVIQPELALESMILFISRKINVIEDYDYLNVLRKGVNWYVRINSSWQLSSRFYFHLSVGTTYADFIKIENAKRDSYHGKTYERTFSPDFSFAADWRISQWLSFHSTASYGTTFLYLDNEPRKYQFTYGFCIKPFRNNKRGFLRHFHVQLASLTIHYREAQETLSLPIPLYPFFYWQWGGNE